MKKRKILENFEIYKKGVARLHELEKELNQLDTSGFKKEEKTIRKKLKKVSLIPEIEEDIRKLRQKIAGIDIEYQQARLDKRQNREIDKLRKEEIVIEHKIPAIKRKISVLEKEAEKALKKAGKKELTKRELKDVKHIPALKKRIIDIKKKAEKALKLAYKKHLTKKEIKNVDKIPTLEGKLNYLKKRFKGEEKEIRRIEEIEKGFQPIIAELIDRISELSRLETKLNSVRRKIGTIGKELPLLEENISEIRFDELPAVRNKIAGLKHELKGAERLILEVTKQRKQLTSEEKSYVKLIPEILAELTRLEENVRKAEKSAIPRLKNQLQEIQKKIEQPYFKNRRKILEKHIIQNFETYKKGIARLKELEAELNKLDTRKFKREERIIREKLKNVALIPEIENDLRNLKLAILGIDTRYQKELVDKKQDRKISTIKRKEKEIEKEILKEQEQIKSLPTIRRRLSFLRRVFGIAAKKISKEEEDINRIKRRMASLSKEKNKIEDISNKIDATKEELNKKLVEEISESKWMIAKEKQEIQADVRKIIEDMAFQLAREKQELNKQFISELKKLEEKAENDKREIYDLFLKRIVSMRQKIAKLEKPREVEEIQKPEEKYGRIEAEIKSLKEELEDFIRKEEKQKLELKRSALEKLKEEFSRKKKEEEKKEAKKEEIEEEFKEEMEKPKEKIISLPVLPPSIQGALEIPEKKLKKVKKIKIGKTAIYLEEGKFEELYGDVKDLKITMVRNKEDIKVGIAMQKDLYEKEMNRINEATAKIMENINRMKANLPLKD